MVEQTTIQKLHRVTHALIVGVGLILGLLGGTAHLRLQQVEDAVNAVCQEVVQEVDTQDNS